MASYCAASDVAILTPMLTGGASNFSASTQPTLTQVEELIRDVAADLNAHMRMAGYSGSVVEGTDLYRSLKRLNTIGAAGMAEITRIVDTLSAGERSRGQVLWRMYERQREALLARDLSSLGMGLDTVGPYAGGALVSDKEKDEKDSDVVAPRFKRGKFRFSRLLEEGEDL